MRANKKIHDLDSTLGTVGGECLKGSNFENEGPDHGFVAETVAVRGAEEKESNRD
jgi:hypothetical protein